MDHNKDKEIEKLRAKTCHLYYDGKLRQAARLAEQLADLLGDPTPESLRWEVHSWVLIMELRGRMGEAIRIAQRDIVRHRTAIRAGDYDTYPKLLLEQLEYLQSVLFFQAERLRKIGNSRRALACLKEARALAEKHAVEFDEDVASLLRELTEEKAGLNTSLVMANGNNKRQIRKTKRDKNTKKHPA